jgi:predicted Rossmann fold nucleotide-binding protein DprA/Smf involved in DNA uptake
MRTALTTNTQAILLLTSPLIVGKNAGSAPLLTLSEYNRVARILREKQMQPSDLFDAESHAVDLIGEIIGRTRLDSLLERGFQLSQAVERWNARGIWVVTRADAAYPRRLKNRLKEDAPPVLYGCGDIRLLENGGLAVVGSRHVDEQLLNYTQNIGKLAAKTGQTLVSGGAKGIDRAAMEGALRAGGCVTGVLADSLERAALAADNRESLMDGKLTMVSPFDPSAGFNVGNAMQRNKVIYALADAALVVTSDYEKGGTWTGAIEQLGKYRFVPVFVRSGASAGKGNLALIKRGAHVWPEPQNESQFNQTISETPQPVSTEPKQETLSLELREKAAEYSNKSQSESEPIALEPKPILEQAADSISPSAKLFQTVREILVRALSEPKSETEIAELLSVSKPQAKDWMHQLVNEGVLRKLSKPVRYQVAKDQRLL